MAARLMKQKNLIKVGLALVAVGGIATLLLSQTALAHRVESVECGNQMFSIGCAARLWASDTGNYPKDFRSLSNEIIVPKLLHCPSDVARLIPRSWAEVTPESISYEILSPGMDATNNSEVFFRCKFHTYLGFGDGTVFDGKRRRTKELF